MSPLGRDWNTIIAIIITPIAIKLYAYQLEFTPECVISMSASLISSISRLFPGNPFMALAHSEAIPIIQPMENPYTIQLPVLNISGVRGWGKSMLIVIPTIAPIM
jgi:hypothetical protein